MADWKDYKTTKYTGFLNGTTRCDGFISVTLQYDADSVTPTSMKIRFKIDSTSAYWRADEYFIFWRPNDKNDEQFFRVKEAGVAWPDYSKTLTLSKTYSASGFSIPEYWLCHTGNICNGKTVFTKTDGYLYMTYGDAATKKIYWYFTNNRQNFKVTVSAFTTKNIAKSVATDVGTGTVSITDNGDNTFTLKGTKGANGTNNTASGPILKWGYNTNYANTFKNGDKVNLTIATASDATRTVYAKSVTEATYGSDKTATKSLAIKQYVAPSKAGKPTISWTRSRMTIKENWTISWGAATATNSSSPIAGYRVRVFVNGSSIPIKNDSGTILTSDTGVNDGWRYYYDRDKTSTSMTFYVGKHSIKPGDKIKVCIHAYTKNGKGTKLYSEGNTSSEYTVRYAGVMKVKVSNAWKEGQVYVKVNGAWKEAEVVHTKVSGSWKETG